MTKLGLTRIAAKMNLNRRRSVGFLMTTIFLAVYALAMEGTWRYYFAFFALLNLGLAAMTFFYPVVSTPEEAKPNPEIIE